MIVDRTPQENAAMGFQRPGLSFGAGRYNGYNPLFAGNQPAPGRAADWNWLSLHFSPMQSSLQSGAAINTSGQTLQNVRIFGLALPDQPQGQILFPNAINQVTSSASLFWDNTNVILRDTGALQIGTATDATAAGDACFGTLNANRMSFIGASPALNLYGDGSFTVLGTVAAVGFVLTAQRSNGTLAAPTRVTAASSTNFAITGKSYGNTGFVETGAILFTSDLSTGITDTDGAGRLEFFTTAAGTTTRTERMRIDSGGLIGINTTTARQRLDILDASNPQCRLTFTDNSVYTDFTTQSTGSLKIAPTGPSVLFPDGTKSNPGMAFASEIGMGWYRVNVGTMAFGRTGTTPFLFSPTLFRLASNVVLSWTATSGDATVASEIQLQRDAANTLAQINGNNAQTFRTYAGNGANLGIVTFNESLTIAAASSTDSTTTIPAGAIILGVAVRVMTTIPTAATFTVTAATGGNTFDTAAVSTAANSTDAGTAAGALYTAAGTKIRITPNINPATATGVVRICGMYYLSTPPTS